MADKYLSIITNFGCHYSCPECIVRNNKLKMTPTDENSSWDNLSRTLGENPDMNWVSVSGGGDPLFHWWEHQFWWLGLFTVCSSARRHLELHTSYLPTTDSKMFVLFPYSMFDRIVYHVHNINELKKVTRAYDEIVRVFFVVDDSMTEDDINAIADFVEESDQIDEFTFRQRVDEHYKETYHLHDFLLAGHQKRWWYVTQCDYNTYYHNGKLYTKYADIFDKE